MCNAWFLTSEQGQNQGIQPHTHTHTHTGNGCIAMDDKEQWASILKSTKDEKGGRDRQGDLRESVCVCVGELRQCYGAVKSAPRHHHLIKHPNGRRSYLSKRDTNEREAARGTGERESENDILEKNGVRYYVTGFQKTIKGLCTCACIYSCTHAPIRAHTQTQSWISWAPFPCSRSVKPAETRGLPCERRSLPQMHTNTCAQNLWNEWHSFSTVHRISHKILGKWNMRF